MKQYNCKNCGAPIEHSYNHKCPYCKSIVDFNEPIENTIEVKLEDLINIELRDIEISPFNDSFHLLFSGYKCSMPRVYEFDNKETYISQVEEYINPPKCGFVIEIPKNELERYGIGYLKSRIINSGIRYNEIEKVIGQILTSSNHYFRRYL